MFHQYSGVPFFRISTSGKKIALVREIGGKIIEKYIQEKRKLVRKIGNEIIEKYIQGKEARWSSG